MKLMLEIDVYGALYHGKENHAGRELARTLRWLADFLEPKTIEMLELVHNDVYAGNGSGAKIGNVLVD